MVALAYRNDCCKFLCCNKREHTITETIALRNHNIVKNFIINTYSYAPIKLKEYHE